ncbi:hypothetical protein F5Y16DRAFT_400843 [Xylariaceae sp. FL0255]|nr:hypothetical protein F5Y16DRAFT_400843 [Xylariaceae sp. FL0255]
MKFSILSIFALGALAAPLSTLRGDPVKRDAPADLQEREEGEVDVLSGPTYKKREEGEIDVLSGPTYKREEGEVDVLSGPTYKREEGEVDVLSGPTY